MLSFLHSSPGTGTGMPPESLAFLSQDYEDFITVIAEEHRWRLPGGLLKAHSGYIRDKVGESFDLSDVWDGDMATFGLFVQFIFTGSWMHDKPSDRVHDIGRKMMKAISASRLGEALNAPRFHSYAFKEVWYRCEFDCRRLGPQFASRAYRSGSLHVRAFLSDLIVRGWGRTFQKIDSTQDGWLDFFKENPRCRDRVLVELGKRNRANPLHKDDLSKYLMADLSMYPAAKKRKADDVPLGKLESSISEME